MPKKKEELSFEEKLKKAVIPKEEEPYKIPDNWVWTSMNVLVDVRDGTHDSPEFHIEGYPLITSKNLKQNKVSFEDVKLISKEDMDKINQRSRVEKGDILYAMIGTIGNPVYCNFDSLNRFAVKNVAIFKPFIKELGKYLNYYLESENYKFLIKDKIKGTTQKFVPLNILRSVYFPVSPLEEQKRIVEKLDSLFEKTQKIKEIIEEVKEKTTARREAILAKAFTGELTEKWRNENKTECAKELLEKINDEKLKNWEEEYKKAEEEGNKKPAKPKLKSIDEMLVPQEEQSYKIPDSWVWIKLGELGEYKKGPFGSSLTKSIFVPKGEKTIKVYEQKNAIQKDWKLGRYYISEEYFETNMKSFEVKEKDIIVSCAGTIGETYIMPPGIDKGIINQALMKITLSKNINYMYYLFYFDYILKKTSNLLSKGSAIKNIPPFKVFKELPVPLPPLEEQQEIVNILDNIFEKENKISELVSLENQIEILEKSILDKAFRGELGTNSEEDTNALELLKNIINEF